jgi:hypothetical protein
MILPRRWTWIRFNVAILGQVSLPAALRLALDLSLKVLVLPVHHGKRGLPSDLCLFHSPALLLLSEGNPADHKHLSSLLLRPLLPEIFSPAGHCSAVLLIFAGEL